LAVEQRKPNFALRRLLEQSQTADQVMQSWQYDLQWLTSRAAAALGGVPCVIGDPRHRRSPYVAVPDSNLSAYCQRRLLDILIREKKLDHFVEHCTLKGLAVVHMHKHAEQATGPTYRQQPLHMYVETNGNRGYHFSLKCQEGGPFIFLWTLSRKSLQRVLQTYRGAEAHRRRVNRGHDLWDALLTELLAEEEEEGPETRERRVRRRVEADATEV